MGLFKLIEHGVRQLRHLARGYLEPPLDVRAAQGVAYILSKLCELRLGVAYKKNALLQLHVAEEAKDILIEDKVDVYDAHLLDGS